MVVYQALYGDFKIWVRPLDMFLEEVRPGEIPGMRCRSIGLREYGL